MILITQYYVSPNSSRQIEINKCLYENAKNNHIDEIHLLNEMEYDLSFIPHEFQDKIKQITIKDDTISKKRLTYKYAFQYINTNLKNKICILSNADIYFDDSLKYFDGYNIDNVFITLGKYNDGVLHNKAHRSHDSWIFKSPVNINFTHHKTMSMGTHRCDHIIAFIAQENGYKLTNPSLTIKSHHEHKSAHRNYNYLYEPSEKYVIVYVSKLTNKIDNKLVKYDPGNSVIKPNKSDTAKTGTKPNKSNTIKTGTKPNKNDTAKTGTKPNKSNTMKTGIKPNKSDTMRTGIKPNKSDTMRTGIKPNKSDTAKTGIKPNKSDTAKTGIKPNKSDTAKTGIKPNKSDTMRTGIKINKSDILRMGANVYKRIKINKHKNIGQNK